MDGKEAIVHINEREAETSLGTFDSVIVSVGHRPFDPFSEALRSAGLEVAVVGDARAPGQIWDATQEARNTLVDLLGRGKH